LSQVSLRPTLQIHWLSRKRRKIQLTIFTNDEKVAANSNQMANNGSPVEAVSKVILEAVTSKKPNFRYLAGKNAETWAANKKTMSDIEFHNSIKNFAR
jgi:hypothetical protein